MRKEIKPDGTSHKIRIDHEDMKVYRLKVGDIVEIDIKKLKEKDK